MALIAYADYRALSDDLAAARDSQLLVATETFEAVYKVVMFQDINQEVDMLNDFWDTYLVNSETFETPATLLGAVRSMNQHVLKRSAYTTIDAYLVANAGCVTSTFSDLSSAAGYPITQIC